MTTKHNTLIVEKRFYFILRRFRAKCKKCGWLAPWRVTETGAVVDSVYHDDLVFYQMLTKPFDDEPSKP